ncbi:MAG: hypothetical protein BWX80_02731 [Candidatus Hydrogenedentes bacterium ADurb.Bin101]|nr:MAG: hypothetical protein BWX80_02731 [Candidatus Hydrogenedentes bacterium ADurb.Bin101]
MSVEALDFLDVVRGGGLTQVLRDKVKGECQRIAGLAAVKDVSRIVHKVIDKGLPDVQVQCSIAFRSVLAPDERSHLGHDIGQVGVIGGADDLILGAATQVQPVAEAQVPADVVFAGLF